jgi:hypothetical protein
VKRFLNRFLDGLTYRDLAGRRQLRAFTAISLLILFLLSLVGGMSLFQRVQMMSVVQATPVPVEMSTEVPLPTTEPVESHKPVTCPTDPADWSLADVFMQSNYKTIQPACVYAGLERTVAWALAVRSGYSRGEATKALGFDEMPMARLDQVAIQTNANGPMDVPVSFIPPNPDFTEWRVDEDGQVAVTYGLRGCFRTSTQVGNRVEVWGGDYPVVCMVAEDAENTYTVYALDDHIYTAPATPMRSFLLFGYLEEQGWVWLGTQTEPKHEIDDPEAFANERQTMAVLYDSRLWDSRWLMDSFNLYGQPLPEDWQARTDPADSQAILSLLNAYVQAGVE